MRRVRSTPLAVVLGLAVARKPSASGSRRRRRKSCGVIFFFAQSFEGKEIEKKTAEGVGVGAGRERGRWEGGGGYTRSCQLDSSKEREDLEESRWFFLKVLFFWIQFSEWIEERLLSSRLLGWV